MTNGAVERTPSSVLSPRSFDSPTVRTTRHRVAVELVRWARERVPLYRTLYAGEPPTATWADFQRLPALTTARLRGTPLCEQVDTLDDVLRSQTAYALRSVVTPRTLVLDADDADAAFDQTRDAFALAGVRKGMRVVLLAAPEQRYIAAEIADQLGYASIEAHLVIALDTATVSRTLAALEPARTICFGVNAPTGVRGVITVRQPGGEHADLYIVPEAGIVAVRGEGGAAHHVLGRFCLLQQASGDRLLLTALRRSHQPLIRYELPDRGRLARGRLTLTEVAP